MNKKLIKVALFITFIAFVCSVVGFSFWAFLNYPRILEEADEINYNKSVEQSNVFKNSLKLNNYNIICNRSYIYTKCNLLITNNNISTPASFTCYSSRCEWDRK